MQAAASGSDKELSTEHRPWLGDEQQSAESNLKPFQRAKELLAGQ
jgi:hypothetical protein